MSSGVNTKSRPGRARFQAAAESNIRDSIAPERVSSVAFESMPIGFRTGSARDPSRYRDVRRIRGGSIRVDAIRPDPDQPRKEFDPASLEELAESLKARGQLQPIRVRWKEGTGWVIVSGERRWRAAKLAGLESLDAVEASGTLSDRDVLLEQLTENCLREDLRPIEQAKAFQALMASEGWTQSQVAEHLGVSQSRISKALSLLSLPPDVQRAVDQGDVTARDGYRISRIPEPSAQRQEVERTRVQRRDRERAALETTTFRVPGGKVVVSVEPGSDPAAALRAALEKATESFPGS